MWSVRTLKQILCDDGTGTALRRPAAALAAAIATPAHPARLPAARGGTAQ
jgi:hypothetical protein